MGQLDVIDVTVVGGPDVGARVTTTSAGAGRRLDIELAANATVPARIERVGILIEAPAIRHLAVHGWLGRDGVARMEVGKGPPPPPGGPPLPANVARAGDAVSHQLVVTDDATVGWMGTGRHSGIVVVQRDGWLLTAWALLDGLILGPGETVTLDPLWLGPGPAGSTLVALASAWADDAVGSTLRTGLPGAVWMAPGPLATAVVAAPGLAALGVTVAVVDPGPHRPGPAGAGGGAAVAAAGIADGLHRAGLGAGVVVGPDAAADPATGAIDLTRPDTAARLTGVGVALAATGIDWVSLDGWAATLTRATRWGDASTTPHAALRAALAALRTGLGPGPVLHLMGSPVGVAPAVVDVVECTATTPPATVAAAAGDAAIRSPFQGRVWSAASGPIDPEGWTAVRDYVGLLVGTTTTAVLTGDPATWTAPTRATVQRLSTPRLPIVDGLDPWAAPVAVTSARPSDAGGGSGSEETGEGDA